MRSLPKQSSCSPSCSSCQNAVALAIAVAPELTHYPAASGFDTSRPDAHPRITRRRRPAVSDGDPQQRQQSRPLAGAALRERLERAADGLLYTSEIDVPFEYVCAARRAGASAAAAPPDAREVAALFGAGGDEPLGERTLDDFFARHIERVDPADGPSMALVPRFEALKAALRESLRDARAVRVGKVEVRCYVVGLDARGDVAGLA